MRNVALVTGGGSGIGLATANALSRDGYDVIIAGRRAARLKAAAHGPIVPIVCDVSDAAAVGRLVDEIETRWGHLDVLVNSAGLVHPGHLENLSLERIDLQISVNLVGTIQTSRAALALLRKRGGSIINVGSTLARRPSAGIAVYAATKGGIEAFTRALAIEVATDRIRVNAVVPALVDTDIYRAAGMSDNDFDTLVDARAREYPLGRIGQPQEVADLISFLVSDKAAWITGACIPIDGGSGINTIKPRSDG